MAYPVVDILGQKLPSNLRKLARCQQFLPSIKEHLDRPSSVCNWSPVRSAMSKKLIILPNKDIKWALLQVTAQFICVCHVCVCYLVVNEDRGNQCLGVRGQEHIARDRVYSCYSGLNSKSLHKTYLSRTAR